MFLNNTIFDLKEKNTNLEGFIPYAEFNKLQFNGLNNQIMSLKDNEKILLERINSFESVFEKVNKENSSLQKIIEEYKIDQKRTQKIIEEYQ